MFEYEPVEKGEVIESIISNMIGQEDSFGLSRVSYIRDFGCLNVLYIAYKQGLRPYESNVYIYIYILVEEHIKLHVCRPPVAFTPGGKGINGVVEQPHAQWIIPNPKTKRLHIIL